LETFRSRGAFGRKSFWHLVRLLWREITLDKTQGCSAKMERINWEINETLFYDF